MKPTDPQHSERQRFFKLLEKAGITHSYQSSATIEGSGWSIVLEEMPALWPPIPGGAQTEERLPDVIAELSVNENLVLKALVEFKKGRKGAKWYFLPRRSALPYLSSPHIRTNAEDEYARQTLGVVSGVGWLDFPQLGYEHGRHQRIFDKVATDPEENQRDFYKACRQLAVGERAILQDEFSTLFHRKRQGQKVPELTYFISVIVTKASLHVIEIRLNPDGTPRVTNQEEAGFLVYQSTRPPSTSYQPLEHRPIREREIFIRQHIFVVTSKHLPEFLERAKTANV